MLNPKVALFYLTLLPQFIRPGFLGRIGETLRRPRVRRALEGVTGALLIGLGARSACDRR